MSIRPGFWLAPLAMSLAMAGGGVCFAKNHSANATAEVSTVETSQDSIAAEFAEPALVASAPATDAGTISTETLAAGPAEPAPKPSSHSSYSKVGIGIKISTLGAGIEAATPLGRKFNLRG